LHLKGGKNTKKDIHAEYPKTNFNDKNIRSY